MGAIGIKPVRLTMVTAVAIAVAMGLAGCRSGIQNVSVATAASRTVHDNPGGVGPVVASVDVPISLDPTLYRGRIQVTTVSVIPGAHVTKGQPLINLDPTAIQVSADVVQQQLTAAQSQVAAAQRTTNTAAAEQNMLGGLQQQIAALQSALDADATAIADAEFQAQQSPSPQTSQQLNAAHQKQSSDQASLAAAQGNYQTIVARVGASTGGGNATVDILNAQVGLDQQLLQIAQGASPTITSPIDGDVMAVNIAQGQSAQPGVALVEIIDPSKVRVTAKFPISERSQVVLGAPAGLTFGAVPGAALKGTVISVVPSSADGLTFQAIVQADNPANAGPRILPGLTANVSIDAVRKAAVAVPRICVLNIDQSPQAFVVDSRNIAHLRTLRIGAVDADTVEVLSGLAAGDHCVTAGNQALSDGATVRVTQTDG